jgi:hypothetical protein
MRILHCVPTFWGGGIEKLLSGLARTLRRRGSDVHVVYVREGPNLAALIDADVERHPLGGGFYDHARRWRCCG